MANLKVLLSGFFLCISFVFQRANAGYQLEIMFFEYRNPSHLCAGCADSGEIVCCDDLGRSEDCISVGPQGCDTRLRWLRREFGTSNTTVAITQSFEGGTPGFISDDMFDILAQYLGPGRSNPLLLTGDSWPGSIQFYVEALDAREPGTDQPRGQEIDRFVIDLSILLGADFTDRTAYTGFYGIAMIDLSFRVSCSENYFGRNCTTLCISVAGQSMCNNEGQLLCIRNRDQSTNCIQCVPGYIGENCDEPDCSAEPCQNGGTCIEDGTQKECLCLQGFEGNKCEFMTTPKPATMTPKTVTMTTATTMPTVATTTSEPSTNAALIGGVVGGISALFLIVIILLLLIIVLVFVLRSRRTRAAKLDIQVTVRGGAVENPNYVLQDVKKPGHATAGNSYADTTTTTDLTLEHNFDNPLYDDTNPTDYYSDPWGAIQKSNPAGKQTGDKAAPSRTAIQPVPPTYDSAQEPLPVYAVAHKPLERFTQSQTQSDDDADQPMYAKTNHSHHNKFKQHKYEYIDHTPPAKDSSSQPVYHYAEGNAPKSDPPVYDSAEASLQESKGTLHEYDYAQLNPPPAYTNTTPGHITPEALEHYDLGGQ